MCELMSNAKAAEYLGISIKTLDKWRYTGEHVIPFVKMGRYIKYKKSDLEAFIESRTMTETNTNIYDKRGLLWG